MYARVELLKIGLNQGVFVDLIENSNRICARDEVPFRLEWSEIHLSDKLYGERRSDIT